MTRDIKGMITMKKSKFLTISLALALGGCATTGGTKNAKEPAAQDFLDFLLSKQGQQIFADHGYRPVMDGVTSANYDFPTPDTLFTIADLGGWSKVKDEFFDDQKGIMAKVEQSIGVNPAA